jgi:hypothetical protein
MTHIHLVEGSWDYPERDTVHYFDDLEAAVEASRNIVGDATLYRVLEIPEDEIQIVREKLETQRIIDEEARRPTRAAEAYQRYVKAKQDVLDAADSWVREIGDG